MTIVCSCPLIATIPGKAIAVIDGQRVVVPLDSCPYYCGGATKTTSSDLAALQPQ
jgi:hypothetical protein